MSLYRLPAEWEPHAGTLLTWPHNPSDWPGKLREVRRAYINIIKALCPHEPVWLLTQSPSHRRAIEKCLEAESIPPEALHFLNIQTNRSWIRDYGPISVYDPHQNPVLLNFQFNGWARFPAHHRDNEVSRALAPVLGRPLVDATWEGKSVVLEGGSIDTNGQGILLTTSECLLSKSTQKRNPWMTRQDLESLFDHFFGIEQVIWLGRGIEGDDTHGHVDDITRFTSPDTVITMVESNREDPNHRALSENLAMLRNETDLNIVEIPMPQEARYRNFRIPVSYANFLIANGCVLVPVFEDPHDAEALQIFKHLFSDRKVIGIHSRDILTGLGGIHCISMQVPV